MRSVQIQKAIVLTFDDGPGEALTENILTLLREHDVNASFFLLGKKISNKQEILRKIKADGHDLCTHGYEHPHHWKVNPIRSIRDIQRGIQMIQQVFPEENQSSIPYRPPYGKLNLFSLLYLLIRRIPIVMWTFDSGDTRSEKKFTVDSLRQLHNVSGHVILLHDFERHDSQENDQVYHYVQQILHMSDSEKWTFKSVRDLIQKA